MKLTFRAHAGPDGPAHFNKSTKSFLSQAVASMGLGLLIFDVGMIITMPTIIVGALLNSKEDLTMTEHQGAWFGSLLLIMQPIGSIFSGLLQDFLGRKKCMLAANIPQLASWLMLYFSDNLLLIFVGNGLLGLSIGFMEAPSMSFIGEVCEPQYRGALTGAAQSVFILGVLFQFLLGAALDWRNVCLVSGGITAAVMVFILFIPDSPIWLLMKGREADAEVALRWLRGWTTAEEIKDELERHKAEIIGRHDHLKVKPSKEQHIGNGTEGMPDTGKVNKTEISTLEKLKILKEPRMFKPMFLVTLYFFIAHSLSLTGPKPFLVEILTELKTPMTAYSILVMSGSIQVLGSIVCFLTISKIGKRKLSFITITTNIIAFLLLSTYIYLEGTQTWIPITLFGVIFFCNGYGVITMPWMIIPEVFPLDGKGIACGLLAAMAYIIAFLITASYVYIAEAIQFQGTLLMYSGIAVVCYSIIYLKMPETEGKTLAEIETYFRENNNKKKTTHI